MVGRYGGHLLIATGVLHTLFAVGGFATPLADIGRAGLVNAVDPYPDRQLAFWFLLSGVLLVLFGQLVRWTQARTGTVPAHVAWELVAISVIGAILMPISGFWLVLLVSVLLLGASRARRVARAA